jgi:hypothetical protein
MGNFWRAPMGVGAGSRFPGSKGKKQIFSLHL